MRKLDRYIAWNFLGPFAIAVAFIVGLYVVGDAFGRLDDFLHEAGSIGLALSRMLRLYLLRIPTFAAPVLPVSMLFGAAYGIAQLSGRNELTAMKASGISLWRILMPIYVASVAIVGLGMANREYLVPRVETLVASDLARWTGEADKYKLVTLRVEKDAMWFTLHYNLERRHARSMSITREETGEHIQAMQARPTKDGWVLMDGNISSQSFATMTLKTSLTHRDLELALLDPGVCPLKMLRRLIRSNPQNHSYRLLYHSRLTYPFVGLVLIGLGLPFVIGNERLQRSRLLGIGVCVIICMVFYTVEFIAKDLGHSAYLPPSLAAWLPIAIFGAFGFYLLETLHS